jgi:proline dehydrogenase
MVMKSLVRPLIDNLFRKLSRNLFSGSTIEDALQLGVHIAQRGYKPIFGYWDAGDEIAEDVISSYKLALEKLSECGMEGYVSIKSWAFNNDKQLFEDLLKESRRMGVPLHFDSKDTENTDAMFKMLSDCTFSASDDIGCTLPGRWERSLRDAKLAMELGLNIRVVKGGWPDPDNPIKDPRAGFMDVVAILAGCTNQVRIATHDHILAEESLKLLRKHNTPCELELLYGLPVKRVLPVAEKWKVPVGVYVPYGFGWLTFCLSSICKNPLVTGPLVKNIFFGNYLKQFPKRFMH